MTGDAGTGAAPVPGSFELDAMQLRARSDILVFGSVAAADAVAARVGPLAAVSGAQWSGAQWSGARWSGARWWSPAERDAPAGGFDHVGAFGGGTCLLDAATLTALADLLNRAGQLWLFDRPAADEPPGAWSMRVSTALTHAGFAIVDIVERDGVTGVCAAPVP